MRRWNEFAAQAYLDETVLDDGVLDEWLEVAGFPASLRQHLVSHFKNAGSVLSAYEELKEGA
jgi:hypothetical protein